MSTPKRATGAVPNVTPASTAPKAPIIPQAAKESAATGLDPEKEVAKAIDSQKQPEQGAEPEVIKTGEEQSKASTDGKPSDTVIPQQNNDQEDAEGKAKREEADKANIEAAEAAAKKLEIENENFVIAEKDGQTNRFSKTTWAEIEKAPGGWKLKLQEPEEVKALKK